MSGSLCIGRCSCEAGSFGAGLVGEFYGIGTEKAAEPAETVEQGFGSGILGLETRLEAGDEAVVVEDRQDVVAELALACRSMVTGSGSD
ncbi:MAG: hypothetical protein ACOCZA_11335 [Spirochaetota bacterium]